MYQIRRRYESNVNDEHFISNIFFPFFSDVCYPIPPLQADLIDVLFRLSRGGLDDLHAVVLTPPGGLQGRKGAGGGGMAVARFEGMIKKPTKVSQMALPSLAHGIINCLGSSCTDLPS